MALRERLSRPVDGASLAAFRTIFGLTLAVAALLAAWMFLQLVAPLRAYAYPGTRLWTEQGFRFAWNVMVMEKNGTLEIHTIDRVTGTKKWVDLSEYLTPVQLKAACTQPDLVLQVAHWVAADAPRAAKTSL